LASISEELLAAQFPMRKGVRLRCLCLRKKSSAPARLALPKRGRSNHVSSLPPIAEKGRE
jgi:hypothetical protein